MWHEVPGFAGVFAAVAMLVIDLEPAFAAERIVRGMSGTSRTLAQPTGRLINDRRAIFPASRSDLWGVREHYLPIYNIRRFTNFVNASTSSYACRTRGTFCPELL